MAFLLFSFDKNQLVICFFVNYAGDEIYIPLNPTSISNSLAELILEGCNCV